MIIELQSINKHYQGIGALGVSHILTDISLTICQGDSLAVTGPSGSGKSTLLNIIGTLDSPSSGTVLFDGDRVNGFSSRELSRIRNQHIGFVFQKHYLLPQLNLLENVFVPIMPEKDGKKRKIAKERAMDLLSYVGLVDKVHHFPGTMSVGECQRAAIVRALVNSPEIVLADEPTGSVDFEAAMRLGELLKSLSKSMSVSMIVVTHSPELAAQMDNQYKLSKGSLIVQSIISEQN